MRTRESGMPDEEVWASFFSPAETLIKPGVTPKTGDVVEFGCGYGTFTIPAAELASGLVHALDIDPDMIVHTYRKALAVDGPGLRVVPSVRDFVAHGTGLGDASEHYAMLFNIRHCEQPLTLLHEAWRVLRPGGLLGIMHWNC
jgi:ubiquinone/menaquinone biosynthesis C-methylase UbiE